MPPVTAGNKSVLMTPDPYHTPGYGGFCPQFKYQIGQTFGRTTSRLLRDNDVSSSGQLVLGEIYPGGTTEADTLKSRKVGLITSRTQSWGDQKLGEKMVPGYTGFIPKSQHYFGKRYAENCVNSIADFENDQRTHTGKMHELRLTEAVQSGKIAKGGETLPTISARYGPTPLLAIAQEPQPYISKSAPHHTMSPYYMNNTSAEKRFMSGYTGFVPRARGLLGMGYPLITHNALNEFTDNAKRMKALSAQPVQVHRQHSVNVDTVPIYPVDSGLVPHYTGHIPGEKFRYGQTFGHSTTNSMKTPRPRAVTAAV